MTTTKTKTKTKLMTPTALALALALGTPSLAFAAPTADELAADVARLQAQVKDQRALIMQLVRIEQEHYDLLLRLYYGKGGDAAAATPLPFGGASPEADAEDNKAAAPAHSAPRAATVRGKVSFPGGSLTNVYVYVENVKAPPARGKTAEVAQRDKSFVPEVLVVQRGTRVTFPNYDSVFHNVFSPTAPHPFDLGSYRAGETARSVDMTSPGVVEIFCNVHARMHSNILVVPSALYARVGADGSFELPGVPVGSRKLVVWGPNNKTLTQTIELPASGADVTLTLQAQSAAAHNNKLGQPYGSYKD